MVRRSHHAPGWNSQRRQSTRRVRSHGWWIPDESRGKRWNASTAVDFLKFILPQGTRVCLTLTDTVTNDLPSGIVVNDTLIEKGLAAECRHERLSDSAGGAALKPLGAIPNYPHKPLRQPRINPLMKQFLTKAEISNENLSATQKEAMTLLSMEKTWCVRNQSCCTWPPKCEFNSLFQCDLREIFQPNATVGWDLRPIEGRIVCYSKTLFVLAEDVGKFCPEIATQDISSIVPVLKVSQLER